MRITPVAFSLLSLLVLAPRPGEAQILKRLGDRAKEAAERKAEQKVTQKIDEATSKFVDKSFNAVFGDGNDGGGSSGGSSSGSSKGGGGSRIFNLLPNAPTESRYDFASVVTYEIESMPKGKSSGEIGLMTMQFSKDQPFAGVRFVDKNKPNEGAFNMIFDAKNKSMVMLFESDTGKFSMAYGWKEAEKFSEPASAPSSGGGAVPTTTVRTNGKQVTYSKIGAKRIAGYDAEGYRAEDADGIVDVWVSNDPSLTYGRMMGVAGSMRQTRASMPDSYPVGVLMATETLDKKSGDRGRMTVTSVNTKANVSIDMAQYPKLGGAK